MRLIKRFLDNADVSILLKLEQKYGNEFQPGRQGSGYFKLNLESISSFDDAKISGLLHRSLKEIGYVDGNVWDSYIIKYPIGSHIPPHSDKVEPGFEHHRINAIIKQGKFTTITIDSMIYESVEVHDAYVFRPDLHTHSVPKITDSERLVFSVGFMK